MCDFHGGKELFVHNIEHRPVNDASSDALESIKLHMDGCTTSGLAGFVGDGFVITIEPVQNVKLQPGDCMVLVRLMLYAKAGQELVDVARGLMFATETLVSAEVALHSDAGAAVTSRIEDALVRHKLGTFMLLGLMEI